MLPVITGKYSKEELAEFAKANTGGEINVFIIERGADNLITRVVSKQYADQSEAPPEIQQLIQRNEERPSRFTIAERVVSSKGR